MSIDYERMNNEMKEFQFERKHLTAEERITAIMSILVGKLGVTEEEIDSALDMAVEYKNKELEKDPAAKTMMGLFGGMMG